MAGERTVGRNVSKYNVQRKAYTSRNMDTSCKSVESKYSFRGTDMVNYSSASVVDTPLFSRPRPEGMSSLPAQRSSSLSVFDSNSSSRARLGMGVGASSYKQLPAATFLTHIPKVPRAVRVECGQASAKEFLTKSPLGQSKDPRHMTSKAESSSGGMSNLHSSSTSFVNLSSKSLKSLSSLELPEVLSGALSLNINQLHNYQIPHAYHHHVASSTNNKQHSLSLMTM